MKKIDMFKIEGKYCGRTHSYIAAYEAEYDRKVLMELLAEIAEPKILSYTGLEVLSYSDDNFIANDSIRWLYEMKYTETNTEKDIRECLLQCSIEDAEWTKARNEGYTGIFYRKITFLPEIQELLKKEYQQYIDLLNKLISQFKIEEKEELDSRNQRHNQWKLVKVYQKVMPSGGEDGTDGYIDAEYENTDQIRMRMVNRDVFDFGVYSYPKRLEGTDEALKYDAMTDNEKSLTKWLGEFGDFHGIRM